MSVELRRISEDDWLGDVDADAWSAIIEARGGCHCHASPPCSSCCEPVTEAELNDVGFTYLAASKEGPSDARS